MSRIGLLFPLTASQAVTSLVAGLARAAMTTNQ